MRSETNERSCLTRTLDRINAGLVAAIALTLLLPLLRLIRI